MRIWVILPMIILGSIMLGAQAYVPFDLRIFALLFMLVHIHSENFQFWDGDSFFMSLAIIAILTELLFQIGTGQRITFWLVSFQLLTSGVHYMGR